MPKSSRVPPLSLLIAVTAKEFSADPTQPHLYSGLNYVIGAMLVQRCAKAHLQAQIEEAKNR